MAEIVPSRIDSLSDPNSGPQDQPARKPRAKAATAEKPNPAPDPDLGPPDEQDKHKLDEMA